MDKLKKYAYQEYDSDNKYSPLILDLIDEENERFIFRNNLYPNDKVWGYTFKTIQTSLKGVTKVNSFKENIKKQKPSGITDADIDLLFKTFEDRW